MESKVYEELLFKDWIAQKEWKDLDWIILSRFTTGDDPFWTHSVLLYLDRFGEMKEGVKPEKISNIKKQILEKLFEDYYLDNDLHGDFGIPDLGMKDELYFNDETIDDRGLRFRPIIYTYSYSDGPHRRSDPLLNYLSPDFVTLYKLKRQGNTFTRIDSMGNEIEVVKIEYNESNDTILKMRINYLRDYITLANMALVRIHSHIRYRNGKLVLEEHQIKEKDHYYRIWAGTHMGENIVGKPGKTRSLLRGIDIKLPYDNPINENRILGPKPKIQIEFIIGRNKDGTNIMRNPKEAKHSNQSFLIPVCFKKSVMQKFYQRSETYSIIEGIRIEGPSFQLPYNSTSEDSIMIYLGDLRYLPIEELQYLKSFNISCPKSPISEDRFRRDFLAEFTTSQEIDFQLKSKAKELNNIFKENFGFRLFKTEKSEVLESFIQIHLPVTNDRKEFEDIINIASKALIESIPNSELRKLLNNPEEWKESRSLKVLEQFLLEKFPKWSNPIEFLFYLSDFRNKIAAHLSGGSYRKFLAKLNLVSKSNKEISIWLFKGIKKFLDEFITILKSS